MTQQLLSFSDRAIAGDHRAEAEAFVRDHPEVFEMFLRFAREAVAKGAKRIGAKAIAERVRWECASGRGNREWKINNSHVSFISRAMVEADPSLGEVLEFRKVVW